MTTSVLIACPCHSVLTDRLESAGLRVVHRPDITYSEALEIVSEYEIMVISTSISIDRPLIDRAQQLRVLGRLGSGLDHIDQKVLAERDILLLSTPEANARAVAEHVVGMLISYTKNISRAEQEVHEGIWRREANRGQEIEHKKVGIIGYGNNGSLTAGLLRALGMQVKVYDPYVYEVAEGLEICQTLDALMEDIDFLTFHVPLDEETHHYLDHELIAKSSRPFVVINISRGEIVDTGALLEALDRGDIRAALLDVIENEKGEINNQTWQPNDDIQKQLRDHPQVYITPHIAGYSIEAKYKMSEIMAVKILEVIKNF